MLPPLEPQASADPPKAFLQRACPSLPVPLMQSWVSELHVHHASLF